MNQYTANPQTIEERFWSYVEKTDGCWPYDCWVWVGSYTAPKDNAKRAYGQLRDGKKTLLAHRFAYELLVGPIPAGYNIDHRSTCPKYCVNPEHLRVVTQKQNMENQVGPQADNRTSGVRGVTWNKRRRKWVIQVQHDGKNNYGGGFSELAEATAAVIALRNRLFTHNDADRNEPSPVAVTEPIPQP